ncbi:ricin-type beta-trefoil lectin domain protein [Saccharothrix xinjiangensis]|uniref:Ricin-type beta-trefoil lectin domain protein n=1 Tax=Saccharothrix xinjiangensis TaxID=204798 RepID=A0ABV9Y7I8_9PSEU
MKFGRVLATAAVAASALLTAPTANATGPDTQQDEWVVQSDTRKDDVWDQTNWAWDPEYPVIPHAYHGQNNQKWHISDDNTIKSKAYGWCVTSVNGRLAGRDCVGSPEQRWVGSSYDGYRTWLFELKGTGSCATHNGVHKELVLAPCEAGRADQRWIIRK